MLAWWRGDTVPEMRKLCGCRDHAVCGTGQSDGSPAATAPQHRQLKFTGGSSAASRPGALRASRFFVVCDGLKGLPDAVVNVWPRAIVQVCIVHYADLRVMPTSRQQLQVAA